MVPEPAQVVAMIEGKVAELKTLVQDYVDPCVGTEIAFDLLNFAQRLVIASYNDQPTSNPMPGSDPPPPEACFDGQLPPNVRCEGGPQVHPYVTHRRWP